MFIRITNSVAIIILFYLFTDCYSDDCDLKWWTNATGKKHTRNRERIIIFTWWLHFLYFHANEPVRAIESKWNWLEKCIQKCTGRIKNRIVVQHTCAICGFRLKSFMSRALESIEFNKLHNITPSRRVKASTRISDSGQLARWSGGIALHLVSHAAHSRHKSSDTLLAMLSLYLTHYL